MKAFLKKIPTSSCTFEIGNDVSWLLPTSCCPETFQGLATWQFQQVALLRITVILKCMLFSLVWVSFQVPFTFYSSGIFNSFLPFSPLARSPSLPFPASWISVCHFSQLHILSLHQFLMLFPFICNFPRFPLQKLSSLPSSFPVSKR